MPASADSALAPPQDIKGGLKSLGKRIKQGVKEVEDLASKYARYARNAAVMRGHHDSGGLDPGAITDLLHKHGIGRGGDRGGAKPQPPPGGRRVERFPVATYAGADNGPVEAGFVSSEFGPRWGKFHSGVDIAADTGEPMLASAPGTVIYAGSGLSGYGKLVIFRHDENVTTLYGHNSRLDVREGGAVKPGARIARVGSTGHSTGPHVHLEIRSGDRPINPRERLPANKYIGK